MCTFFRSLEMFSKSSEFISTKYNSSHIQSNSELCFCNIPTSKFVKISKELTNSDSLFRAMLSKLSKNIFNIIRDILLNIRSCNSWFLFGIIVKGVVISSSYSKQLFRRVHIIAEIIIVDLINITFIHVNLKKNIKCILTSRNT